MNFNGKYRSGFDMHGIARFLCAGALVVGFAGCSSSGDDSEAQISAGTLAATVYVAEGGTIRQNDHTGALVVEDPDDPTVDSIIDPSGDGGMAFDTAGNLVQAGSDGTVRTFCAPAGIAGDPAGLFREITGASSPVAVSIAHEAGYYFVVQGDTELLVYSSTAAGAATQLDTVTLDDNGWDLHYEEADDRLFVALGNGTVAVYDDFIADGFGDSDAARTIDPYDEDTGTSSLRGLAYDGPNDRLVVSDIGAAGGTDGRIFVIENASTAEGELVDDPATAEVNETIVLPSRTITGAATLLGDPVDLVLTGVHLRVADSGTDKVLFFNNLYEASSDGNVAPDSSYASTDPAGLAVASTKVFPSVNDIGSGSGLDMTNVAVTYSDTGHGVGAISHFSRSLGALAAEFDGDTGAVQSVTFDLNGDGYVAFDDGTGTADTGGVAVISRLAKGRDGDGFDADRDRDTIVTMAAPRGITMLGNSGMAVVAESGAAGNVPTDGFGLYVLNNCSDELVTTVNTAAAPWDSDYVEVFSLTVVPKVGTTPAITAREPLFVALTDGTIEVYNKFTAAVASGDPIVPALTISLPNGPHNLHGIHYHSGADTLIVSDVGDTGDATDGRLYVLQGVKSVIFNALDPDETVTTPTLALGKNILYAKTATTPERAYTLYEVTGANVGDVPQIATVLGNPVDLAFDGSTLYVANKTGTPAGLLQFKKFLTAVADADPGNALDPKVPTGEAALDADASVDAADTESISLVPDFLSTTP